MVIWLCCGVRRWRPCPGLAAEPESAPKVKGVGVVLGGGGARGFAHLGVLKELDRLHVPISCIAGTSAGALIGGMYANGLPLADMEQAFNSADWDQMLSGKTTRSSVPYDRKRDDYKNYMDVTLGIKNGQIRVPRSAINSQEIDLFIRKLTRDRSFDSFDQMPIPFRAIATNLSNGDAVVFDKGPLALALRSSMAVPGVFDLVEDQGRLLVDGGLARNLPVQEVKGRCADHVIVVDVSGPLLKPDEINSLFDVVAQTSNIMVDRNVREQLARLDKRDLVVRPQLDAYTSASFADNKAIIALGEAAAHRMAKQLSAYAVSPEEYARWKQSLVRPAIPMVDDVHVQGTTAFVNIQSIEKAVEHKGLAEPIDVARDKLRDIFAQGDYDQLDYSLDSQSGRNVMTVMPVEKSIGPNYLRFGLNLKGSAPGDASFTFLAAHQRTGPTAPVRRGAMSYRWATANYSRPSSINPVI
ncbi:hypothetical protein GKE73_14925 [Paludibacterium sp. dN 18-1]|uniref:PNPLA domain-containing protein n=1 Tax=Paludibacterium denitrificans TaxID=2675226 RepID=A0A844GDW4_9NEIS|nr:hypothetical protein [Paludibacterium denitrificans]